MKALASHTNSIDYIFKVLSLLVSIILGVKFLDSSHGQYFGMPVDGDNE